MAEEGDIANAPPLVCKRKYPKGCFLLAALATPNSRAASLRGALAREPQTSLQQENETSQKAHLIFLAEEGRFELPRQIAPTYSFSKAAPSTTWVLLLALIHYQLTL